MKKLFSLALALVLSLSLGITAFAASPSDTTYETVLNDINKEYGLNLGFVPVDANTISLAEYEKTARSIALAQQALNEKIKTRQEHAVSDVGRLIEPRATKAVTKDVWNYEATFSISATYDVNGNSISKPRSISVNRKLAASLNGINYSPNNGSPTTSIIDSGRSLAVTYYGTYTGGGAVFTNIKFYTEFYYNS